MTDVLGWRALFGILGPSTNTVVQPEFDQMRPAGVTNHYSRIFTPNANAVSNDTFMNATLVIADNVLDAVDSVMTCSPTYLVMGMSAITFYGGINGAEKFSAIGNKKSAGTKLVCLDSFFNKPGVYEIDMGTPMKKIFNEIGGGYKKPVKAFQIGGPLGGVVPLAEIEKLNLDFNLDGIFSMIPSQFEM